MTMLKTNHRVMTMQLGLFIVKLAGERVSINTNAYARGHGGPLVHVHPCLLHSL